MAGVNKAIIIGRLGKDPEVSFTPNGVAVARMSVATSKTWKDKDTGEKREKTQWHKIVVWRRLAEVCGEYLKKGSQAYFEGEIETRSWEDQESGQTKWITEIVAYSMQMLDSKGSNGSQDAGTKTWTPPPSPTEAAQPAQGEMWNDPDDDIPF